MVESWNIRLRGYGSGGQVERRPCREGGRIDRRTAIRRPSQRLSPISPPLFHHSHIPTFQAGLLFDQFVAHIEVVVFDASAAFGLARHIAEACNGLLFAEIKHKTVRMGR